MVGSDGIEHRHLFERDLPGCLRVTGSGTTTIEETVALELPMPLFVNGVGHRVLACTPVDLEDLAFGVAFSDGLISDASDVASVDVVRMGAGYKIDMRLAGDGDVSHGGPRDTGTSCELPGGGGGTSMPGDGRACGNRLPDMDADAGPRSFAGSSFADMTAPLPEYYPAVPLTPVEGEPVPAAAIWKASRELVEHQGMRKRSGSTHAAAFVDRDGRFLHLREDVGRHNSLDKLIGALLRNHVDPAEGFVFLSSRCALELVCKAARYRIGLIATVSAPTSAAVAYAEASGITLCAYSREERFTVYANPGRVLLPS